MYLSCYINKFAINMHGPCPERKRWYLGTDPFGALSAGGLPVPHSNLQLMYTQSYTTEAIYISHIHYILR